MAATHPVGPTPAAHWYTPSSTCNRSYLLALLRAGVIARGAARSPGAHRSVLTPPAGGQLPRTVHTTR